jgi:3-phenylpropionate/trans-cinnamate dioxygenase ferredoxin reductase subunit
MSPQRIVIIGAGLAGATAAVTLRDEGFDGEIQLIGAEHQLPYNRPPLSKGYLRGEERLEDQLVNPPGIYVEKDINLRLGTRATAIDAEKKHVKVEDGERVAYDRLLVATGGGNACLWFP